MGGHVALSTSLFAKQGQTGFIHGILSRNLNGLYWPEQAFQESKRKMRPVEVRTSP